MCVEFAKLFSKVLIYLFHSEFLNWFVRGCVGLNFEVKTSPSLTFDEGLLFIIA